MKICPVEAEFHGADGRTDRNRNIIRLFAMLRTRLKWIKFSVLSKVWFYKICRLLLCFVDRASLYNFANKANLVHNILSTFISFLYMFRATMCPSSGEITVSMRHLIFVTVYGWLSGMQGATCIPDSHPYQTVIHT
jgi:hypothetical protein